MHMPHTPTTTRLEIQKLNQLPPMPLVAHELLEVFSAGSMDVQRIAAIIERDPALLARLIGLANSAYFGYPEPVVTAEDAIFKVLGINIARSLAFSVVLAGSLQTSHCPTFRVDEYWANAMVTASLAQQLSRLLEDPSPTFAGNAYLAGLLHDFGLLALVHLYPAEINWVFEQIAADPTQNLSSLLAATLGANHAQAGSWLARKWHLPGFVVATIENHRQADYVGEHQTLVQLIDFCSRWASRLWLENEALELSQLESLGIPQAEARDFLTRMLDERIKIRSMAKLLSDA
ncbi:MAG: HDOD domain-containing protein [Thiohalomonadaceae bacterium]